MSGWKRVHVQPLRRCWMHQHFRILQMWMPPRISVWRKQPAMHPGGIIFWWTSKNKYNFLFVFASISFAIIFKPHKFFFRKVTLSCMGSPCIFGCIPSGANGPTCGCPNGYRTVGQGHCLSTINEFNQLPQLPQMPQLPQLPSSDVKLGKLPYTSLPEDLPYQPRYEKILSTEGCFTCRVCLCALLENKSDFPAFDLNINKNFPFIFI